MTFDSYFNTSVEVVILSSRYWRTRPVATRAYICLKVLWGGSCRFFRDTRGVFALKLGLMAPVFLMLVGLGIDHARFVRDKGILQSAADAAALAAAKELSMTDVKYESLAAVAQAVVERHVAFRASRGEPASLRVATSVSSDPIEVAVQVTRPFEATFANLFGSSLPEVAAKATARIVGRPNICVLALSPQDIGAISLEKDARLTGQNCAVYSNSASSNGLKSKNSAILTATFICTRGGKDGGPGNFNPSPLLDCPSYDDPLADRPEPQVGPCDPKKPTRITSDTTLEPGTYCGLEIAGGARVTLRDGIFAFKDKPLVVKDGGALFSEAAGLYFSGAATMTFERQSTISLKAPVGGPMAGLLIFGSRSQSSKLVHQILSDDARTLIGTVYLPSSELRIDATSPIADKSAFTAIVVNTMRLYGGPHLILNTSYDDTEIPVPTGIRGVGQPVTLAE